MLLNLDALTYAGNPANVAAVAQHPHYRFIHGDIRDADLLHRLFATYDIDGVLHLAAESHVDRSIANAADFVATNVVGTHALLQAAHLAWQTKAGYRPGKRFLLVSTDEVYGSCCAPDGFGEDAGLNPSNPYAASKAAADLMALAYRRTYGLPLRISRSVNNYGPRQYPEKLIPRLISRAMGNRSLPIYGDGSACRDWLYVADHCRALTAILERGQDGHIYHLAAQQQRSVLQVAEAVLQELQKPHSLLQYTTDRPAHDLRYALDDRPTRHKLSWQPQIGFKEGLRQTVAWYLAHTDRHDKNI